VLIRVPQRQPKGKKVLSGQHNQPSAVSHQPVSDKSGLILFAFLAGEEEAGLTAAR
jgi:hypothetical protein